MAAIDHLEAAEWNVVKQGIWPPGQVICFTTEREKAVRAGG